MNSPSDTFHFPSDIELKLSPLLEAWLEIRWQLEPGSIPDFKRDPSFPFALGAFYGSVKDRFGYREKLEASRAPEDMFPYVVRHRFRAEEDAWPLIQLGPGVATINFTDRYTWTDFEALASYLRRKLVEAYGDTELKTQQLILRYRNGEPFDYKSNNWLDFVAQKLNTNIALPDYIPGQVSSTPWAKHANIDLRFDLLEPAGTGTLRLGTGVQRRIESEQEETQNMVIWQLEVASGEGAATELSSEDEFMDWLTLAHDVIHEWFFSLIDGALLSKYQSEED